MTKAKDRSPLIGDIEMPFPAVADSIGDELEGDPLTVKLGDLWSDFVRFVDRSRKPLRTPGVSALAAPLLDDTKGILQWD